MLCLVCWLISCMLYTVIICGCGFACHIIFVPSWVDILDFAYVRPWLVCLLVLIGLARRVVGLMFVLS